MTLRINILTTAASVVLCALAYADTVDFDQMSEPPGLFAAVNSQEDAGTTVATIGAASLRGGKRFTYWTINGVRQIGQAGTPVNPVSFTIFEDTTATALYLLEADDLDNDGISDWFELQSYTGLVHDAMSNTDLDGFNFLTEYRRGLKPTISNTPLQGVVATRRSMTFTAIIDPDYSTYTENSSPGGVMDTESTVLSNGTEVATRIAPLISGSLRFTHWNVDGVRQADSGGTGPEGATLVITGDTIATAFFVDENDDTDGDGVPDWFELRRTGSATNLLSADPDDDGFDLALEYRRDLNPVIKNTPMQGVIAYRRLGQPLTRAKRDGDADGDGIADDWETEQVGHAGFFEWDDVDGDGVTFRNEYRRDLSTATRNTPVPGVVATRKSVSIVANLLGWPSYTVTSEPSGIFAGTSVIAAPGTNIVINVPSPLTSASGRFAYWLLNGQRVENGVGLPLESFSFTLQSNTVAVAHYFDTGEDSDGDGIKDWFEHYTFGRLTVTNTADVDSDGFNVVGEYRRDLSPFLANTPRPGVIAWRRSSSIDVNLQFFPRVREVLENGSPQPFFSADTSSTGQFSIAANSHPAVGDWDGDGDLDLFVGGVGGTLRVFENAGSPVILNLVERTGVVGGGAWTNVANPAPSLGDFNGDGFDDLAIGGSTNTVWLVASPGSFTTQAGAGVSAQVAGVPAFIGSSLLVLKSDGLISLYTNLPLAQLSTADFLGTAVPDARGISVSDVNDDDIPDVLISDQQGRIWGFHGQ